MIRNLFLHPVNLRLFDGDYSGSSGEGTAPGVAAPDSGEDQKVIYGRVEEPDEAETEPKSPAAGEETSESEDDLRKQFKELTRGKFKDIYSNEVQNIINRRYREVKGLEAENKLLSQLADRVGMKYGIQGDSEALLRAVLGDDYYIEDKADDAGLSNDQFRARLEAEAARRQAEEELAALKEQQRKQALLDEQTRAAMDLQSQFKDFSLQDEANNPDFVKYVNAGVPMEILYKGMHFDELMSSATSFSAREAQRATVENIRAKGNRPTENGASSQSAAVTIKSDPSQLTLKDVNEIARRAARGERISF